MSASSKRTHVSTLNCTVFRKIFPKGQFITAAWQHNDPKIHFRLHKVKLNPIWLATFGETPTCIEYNLSHVKVRRRKHCNDGYVSNGTMYVCYMDFYAEYSQNSTLPNTFWGKQHLFVVWSMCIMYLIVQKALDSTTCV